MCLSSNPLLQIAEVGFLSKVKSKSSSEDEKENPELPPSADPETNVYSFGILLLEAISGKLPHSEEQGHLVDWVNLKIRYFIEVYTCNY